MKKPIIYSVTENGENAPIFAQGDYDVFIGALDDAKLPMYVVINRTTNVVEFTNEVTLAYRSFLDHVAPVPAEVAQQQIPLSLALRN